MTCALRLPRVLAAALVACLLLAGRVCLADEAGPVHCGLCSRGVTIAGAQSVFPSPQFGSKPFVTLLVRFGDSPGVTPHPPAFYEALMGSAVPGMDHYFREVSYDNINLAGSIVRGWYNLPHPKAYYLAANLCGIDIDKLKADATAAADADVFFPDFYGINICLNDDTGGPNCGFTFQQVTIDGQTRNYGLTEITRSDSNPATLAHEMGHAFGMYHSSGPYGATYDSRWDVMSGGFNCPGDPVLGCLPVAPIAFARDLLGWVPASRTFRAHPGTNQTFSLERLSLPVSTANFLMARIPIGGSATRFYTIEARKKVGYDLLGNIPAEGIVIHSVDLSRADRPAEVVDTDANGNPNDAGAIWTPGETFTDAPNGVTVKVNSAAATSFSVTITMSASAPDPLVVTNTMDEGPGSLRNALTYANEEPGSTVRFAIATGAPGFDGTAWTIAPASPLPPVTAEGSIIDGATQTLFAGDTNPDGPEVALDGSLIQDYAFGLELQAAGCSVRSLAIGGFSTAGIALNGAGATGCSVTGCYVGVDATATSAAPNGYAGVWIIGGASGATIGGASPGAGNVISGNTTAGVAIAYGGAANNVVVGNFIGTDAFGSLAIPNGWGGVTIGPGASGNRVGGVTPAERNIISGNATAGVGISGADTTGNEVLGNYIGVNSDASAALPNGWAGVYISDRAASNTVGGTTAGSANVVSGNAQNGVAIVGAGTSGNIVLGNFIGTNGSGDGAIANGYGGVLIFNDASGNTVGGGSPNARNILSGNGAVGIACTDRAFDNTIAGNLIGLDATGTATIPNGWAGAGCWTQAHGNTIGGTMPGSANYIAGNTWYGVALNDTGTTANRVLGNVIGAGPLGDPLGNGGSGVIFDTGASGNAIGGTAPGEANAIAFNGGDGVTIYGAACVGNSIRGNSIDQNGFLAINLVGGTEGPWGVTANDALDADTGANNLQNYPDGLSAVAAGDRLITAAGSLASKPSQTYTIDFFRSLSPDASGYGEAAAYLGSVAVSTDVAGQGSFSGTLPLLPSGPFYLSATATSASGDTSEVSEAFFADGTAGSTIISIGSLATVAARLASPFTRFKVIGVATVTDSSQFTLEDPTGTIEVLATGHGLTSGDCASAEGFVNGQVTPPTLTADPGGVLKLF